MSIRKPPQRTSEFFAAARANAQHSTGPRSQAGKQHAKMNAVQHGERSDPDHHTLVMLKLGEDPLEFEYLKKQLLLSYGPGEVLWEKQIDDLAKLYWRRQRLERAQEGLMRGALLAAEERQHRRRLEMADATFDAWQACEIDLPAPADPGVRLCMLLSYLGAIREQAKQGVFEPGQVEKLEALYEKKQGWRQARLMKLLRARRTGTPACPTERIAQPFQPLPEAGKPPGTGKSACATDEHQDLLRLLDEEIAFLEKEFQYAENLNQEQAAATRDACLAPDCEQWKVLLRREEHLDRAIDRKVRILLAMRKEFRKPKPPDEYWDASSPEEQAELNEMIWGDDKPSDFPWEDTMSEPATATKVPSAAAPPLSAKIDERTENVYENKGPVVAAAEQQRPTPRGASGV
jgi:hypothetical protein